MASTFAEQHMVAEWSGTEGHFPTCQNTTTFKSSTSEKWYVTWVSIKRALDHLAATDRCRAFGTSPTFRHQRT